MNTWTAKFYEDADGRRPVEIWMGDLGEVEFEALATAIEEILKRDGLALASTPGAVLALASEQGVLLDECQSVGDRRMVGPLDLRRHLLRRDRPERGDRLHRLNVRSNPAIVVCRGREYRFSAADSSRADVGSPTPFGDEELPGGGRLGPSLLGRSRRRRLREELVDAGVEGGGRLVGEDPCTPLRAAGP